MVKQCPESRIWVEQSCTCLPNPRLSFFWKMCLFIRLHAIGTSKLFNKLMGSRQFPSSWKRANVSTISKRGDRQLKENLFRDLYHSYYGMSNL